MAIVRHPAEFVLVDGRLQSCRSDASNLANGNSGYAKVERTRLISATEISAIFGNSSDGFARDRVRKALYARGFPSSVYRGRWLRAAVDAWPSAWRKWSFKVSRQLIGGTHSSTASGLPDLAATVRLTRSSRPNPPGWEHLAAAPPRRSAISVSRLMDNCDG
jgi:hypothetical protein